MKAKETASEGVGRVQFCGHAKKFTFQWGGGGGGGVGGAGGRTKTGIEEERAAANSNLQVKGGIRSSSLFDERGLCLKAFTTYERILEQAIVWPRLPLP